MCLCGSLAFEICQEEQTKGSRVGNVGNMISHTLSSGSHGGYLANNGPKHRFVWFRNGLFTLYFTIYCTKLKSI